MQESCRCHHSCPCIVADDVQVRAQIAGRSTPHLHLPASARSDRAAQPFTSTVLPPPSSTTFASTSPSGCQENISFEHHHRTRLSRSAAQSLPKPIDLFRATLGNSCHPGQSHLRRTFVTTFFSCPTTLRLIVRSISPTATRSLAQLRP